MRQIRFWLGELTAAKQHSPSPLYSWISGLTSKGKGEEGRGEDIGKGKGEERRRKGM